MSAIVNRSSTDGCASLDRAQRLGTRHGPSVHFVLRRTGAIAARGKDDRPLGSPGPCALQRHLAESWRLQWVGSGSLGVTIDLTPPGTVAAPLDLKPGQMGEPTRTSSR
jgi:hypothetical protein